MKRWQNLINSLPFPHLLLSLSSLSPLFSPGPSIYSYTHTEFTHLKYLGSFTLFPDRFYIVLGKHRCWVKAQLTVFMARRLGSGISPPTKIFGCAFISVEKLSSSAGDKARRYIRTQVSQGSFSQAFTPTPSIFSNCQFETRVCSYFSTYWMKANISNL